MASEEHIKLLRQGYKVWNKWRQQNPKVTPELKAADLTELKLFKVDFTGANLSEADLKGTSLYQASLSGANLYKANLSGVIFQEANLSEANLIEANLKDNKFRQTNFSGADLSKTNLSGAKFYKSTNLSKTKFSSANLSGADLSELHIKDNDFTGANLCRANLSGVNLSGLDLREYNFSGANLCRANLSGATLSGADLSGANLCRANLSGATLSGADLSGANLEYANLHLAKIQEAIIDEKWYLVWDIVNHPVDKRHLQGADLSMADLTFANLREADLSNVNFRETKLKGANLAKSNLARANLSKTDLSRANLSMTNLSKADLLQADLREANLSGANLNEANLRYAKLHHTQIQEAIINEKWYLVWDIVNNSAEGRDISKADLSEADLSDTNFKHGNLSEANLSKSILNRADFRWTDLNKANLSKANLAEVPNEADFRWINVIGGANFDWADLSKADLSEVEGFDSISCIGADFSGTIFRQTKMSSDSLDKFKEQGASLNEADLSEADINYSIRAMFSIRSKKEFFENLLSWKSQESFNESLKKSLSLSEKSFIPGVLLYTDEDDKLSFYVREHFDALDKLTGDWCTIYLLENPSPKWRKANQNWRKMVESGLNASWFRSKPYDKSEAYDIARQLNIESSSLPCLVLISPSNLSEKLVLQLREVSPEYFRELFSTLERLVGSVSSKELKQREPSSQVFDYLKLNFNEIVNFLEKYASKQEENNSTKYILKGDNISVSIEPVNISNINYNERIEGNYVLGDNTDQSRNLKVGDVGGDFKLTGSALMADEFRASGSIANSINFDQGMTREAELQNRQDEKSQSETSKFYESKSIGKVVGVIVIVLALVSGLIIYIFFQLGLSKYPVSRPSQEQRVKK